jgi:hypothetical protein
MLPWLRKWFMCSVGEDDVEPTFIDYIHRHYPSDKNEVNGQPQQIELQTVPQPSSQNRQNGESFQQPREVGQVEASNALQQTEKSQGRSQQETSEDVIGPAPKEVMI